MSRLQILLTALACVLLIVLFYFLAWEPAQEDIAAIEDQIAVEEATQAQLRTRIGELREVRESAPEVEAHLAAADAVVPGNPALPSALRQLQTAADESGVTLTTVATQRPTLVDEELGIAQIGTSTQVSGSYFQIVDFLRRTEDPRISPRGMLWDSLSVTIGEFPQLEVLLSGSLFTIEPDADLPPAPEDPEEAEEPVEGDEPPELDEDEQPDGVEEGQP